MTLMSASAFSLTGLFFGEGGGSRTPNNLTFVVDNKTYSELAWTGSISGLFYFCILFYH